MALPKNLRMDYNPYPPRVIYPKTYYPKYEPKENYVLDYNDPLTINSIPDILFNQAGLDKQYDLNIDSRALEVIAQRIIGLVDLPYRSTIKPILGEWRDNTGADRLSGFSTALVNTLQNFGETMDILANPIKALATTGLGKIGLHPDSGESFKEALENSLGYTAQGRKNYDFDFETGTGVTDFLANMTGEILSDPFNWISFGAAGVAKKSATSLADEIGTNIAATVAKRNLDMSDDLINEMTRRTVKNVQNNMPIRDAVQHAAVSISRPTMKFDAVHAFRDLDIIKNFADDIAKTMIDDAAFETIRMAHKVRYLSNQAEVGLRKTVSWSSGIAPVWMGTKHVFGSVSAPIRTAMYKALKSFGKADVPDVKTYSYLAEQLDKDLQPLIKAGRVSEEAIGQMKQSLVIESVYQDDMFIYSFLREIQDGLSDKSINAFKDGILKRTGMDFETYVQFVKDYAEQTNVFKNHALLMNEIKREVTNKTATKFAQDSIKNVELTIRILKNFIEGRIDLGNFDNTKNLLKFIDRMIDRINYFGNNNSKFIKIDERFFYSQIVENLTMISVFLEDALKVVPANEMQSISKSLGMQLELANLLKRTDIEGSIRRLKKLTHPLRAMSNWHVDKVDTKVIDYLGESVNADRARELADVIDIAASRLKEDQTLQAEEFKKYMSTKVDVGFFSYAGDEERIITNEMQIKQIIRELVLEDDSPFDAYFKDRVPNILNPLNMADIEQFKFDVDLRIQQMESRIKARHIVPDTWEYGEIYKRLKKLEEELNKIPTAVLEDPVRAINNYTEYTMMLSKVHKTYSFLSNEGMLKNAEDAFKDIEEILNSTNREVTTEMYDLYYHAQSILRSHYQYLHLLDDLYRREDLKEIIPNIFDIIQNYANYDISDSLSKEYFVTDFLDRLEAQLVAVQMDKSYALDKLFAEGSELNNKFNAWLKEIDFEGHAHDAEYDNLRVQFAVHNIPEIKMMFDDIDQTKYIPVYMDIESTGTRGYFDELIQIAAHTESGERINIRIRPSENNYPSADVMIKQLGLSGSVEDYTTDELKALYRNQIGSAEKDQIEGVLEFVNALKEIEQAANVAGDHRKLILVGWNNKRFDDVFLNQLMSVTKSSDLDLNNALFNARFYYKDLEIFDGLRAYHRNSGMVLLDQSQESGIREILNNYIDKRLDSYYTNTKGTSRLFKHLDTEFTNDLKELDRYLRGNIKRDATGELAYVLSDTMTSIKATDDSIHDMLWDFREHNKLLRYTRVQKIGEEIVDAPDGVLNISQINLPDIGIMSTTSAYKTIQTEEMRKYFRPEFIELSDAKKRELYMAVRGLNKTAERIRNIPAASEDYETLSDISRRLIDFYKKISQDSPQRKIKFDYFDIDTVGTAERASMAINIFNDVQHYSNAMGYDYEFLNMLKKLSNASELYERVIKRLHNPMEYYSRNMGSNKYEDMFTNRFFNLRIRDNLDNAEKYIANLQTWTEDVDRTLEDLSILQEFSGVASASAKAEASFLLDLKAEWQKMIDFIKEGPEETLVDRISEAEDALKQYINDKAATELEWLTHQSPEFLERHIWMTHGRLTFGAPYNATSQENILIKGYYRKLKGMEDRLKAHHINLEYDEGLNQVWLYLDNDVDYVRSMADWEIATKKAAIKEAHATGEPLKNIWADHLIEFEPENSSYLPRQLKETFQNIYNMAAERTHGRNAGSLGDMINLKKIQEIDSFAPPSIKNRMIDPAVFKELDHFKGMAFNRTNIGSAGSRRKFVKEASGNIIKNYMNSMQSLANMMDNRTKMTQLFFDDMHALRGPLYDGISTEELFNSLKNHPELRLTALVDDKKFGPIVKVLKPRTAQELQIIRDNENLSATIMSIQAFTQAYKHINQYMEVGGSIGKFFKNNIVLPLKAGYLSSLGFIFRNIVDTMLKNVILADSPTESFRMLKHTLEVHKYYGIYEDILKEVQELSPTKSFSLRGLDKFYELHPDYPMRKDLFRLFHDFIEQGPSAGLSKTQADALQKAYKESKKRMGKEANDTFMYKVVNNPYTRFVMDQNSYLEQVFRLAGYTWELEKGNTMDQAMQAVFKHHFDYTLKSKTEMYLEYVVPFTTFTTQNMSYWMDQLNKNGWLTVLFNDFYTPVWDFQGRDKEELEHNRSLQYNILAGNIIFDNDLVIKLNPSVMDAVRMMITPQEAMGKMAPYVSIPIDMIMRLEDPDAQEWNIVKELVTNIPMIGPTLYRYWGAAGEIEDRGIKGFFLHLAKSNAGMESDTGSALKAAARVDDGFWVLPALLPSIFGGVAESYNNGWTKKLHYPQRVYPEVKKMYPKRLPKQYSPYAKRSYAKRSYARRTWHRRSTNRYPTHAYFRKVFHSKSYVPRGFDPYAQYKVLATGRGNNVRVPGQYRNLSYSAPAMLRRAYSGAGLSRFTNRMVPITKDRMISKLKSDWAYVR